ncbi:MULTISPECIES: morphogenic membrane protein MmpB [Streptomyces]|nr:MULTISPECIES: hypothetical protein [Streptomyces]
MLWSDPPPEGPSKRLLAVQQRLHRAAWLLAAVIFTVMLVLGVR